MHADIPPVWGFVIWNAGTISRSQKSPISRIRPKNISVAGKHRFPKATSLSKEMRDSFLYCYSPQHYHPKKGHPSWKTDALLNR
jgi:hypothetical protein